MTHPKPSNLPLILMTMWYVLLSLCALILAFFGLIWGSEVYRGGGIPIGELAITYGPLLVTVTLLIATIMLWNKGRRTVTYGLFAGSLLIVPVALYFTGFLFI